jgi:NADPH-dependent 2,4-dienoyl-CoA reductase/sulfur reductase-like enzyme
VNAENDGGVAPPPDVDVTVIGAGPAGLAAAAAAARAGLSVLLLDEQHEAGGQVWRAAAAILEDPERREKFGDSYGGAAEALDALQEAGVEAVFGATLVDRGPDGALHWLGPACHRPRLRETRARAVIVATGAMERPVPFPGWTLPGVMGVGALQLAMKQRGEAPEGRVVIAGQGPLALLTLAQLRRYEAPPVAVLDFGGPWPSRAALRLAPAMLGDPMLMLKGARLTLARQRMRTPLFRAITRLTAIGDERLEAVRFESAGRVHEIACDRLAVHDGVIPNTQVSRLLGVPHRWSDAQAAFVPETGPLGQAADDVWIVGDGAGVAGVEAAGLAGRLAGLDAARALGALSADAFDKATAAPRRLLGRRRRARHFLDALHPPLPSGALASDQTILCRCEAVTVGALREAVAAGAPGPNRAKRATRCGMGPCQGRMCGNALTRLLASETGQAPGDVGALRVRPPLKPVLIDDYLETAPGPVETVAGANG